MAQCHSSCVVLISKMLSPTHKLKKKTHDFIFNEGKIIIRENLKKIKFIGYSVF